MTTKKDKYGRELKIVKISGKNYIVSPERIKYTIAKRDRAGRFMGRYSGVPRSDGTKVIRIVKPIDVNQDKIIDLHPGQIVGRVSKYSKYARGPKPESIDVKVYVSNPKSKAAMKETQRDKFRRIRARR